MADKRSNKQKARGTYALVLYLPRTQTMRVGKLGAFKFPRGYYIYIGSALSGLAQRIARHLRPDKKRFWHIDYFLEHAQVKEIWTHQGDGRLECLWVRAALALPRARVVAPRFGASDCDCPTHLIYFGAAMPKLGRGQGEA
jgi:Uri superfamily endonuclease